MKCPTWRLLWVVFALAVPMQAQTYTQRGFIETPVYLYPEKAPNDSTRLVAQALARYEGFFKPFNSLQVNGAVDLRLDSHRVRRSSRAVRRAPAPAAPAPSRNRRVVDTLRWR